MRCKVNVASWFENVVAARIAVVCWRFVVLISRYLSFGVVQIVFELMIILDSALNFEWRLLSDVQTSVSVLAYYIGAAVVRSDVLVRDRVCVHGVMCRMCGV